MSTIKFKNADIIDAVQPLTQLLEAEMPMSTALKATKIANTINTALTDFRTLQGKLAESCAVLDEDGNKKMNGEDWEKTPEYVTKMQELLDADIAYDITPITQSELGTKGTIQPKVLFLLVQSKFVVLD